MILLDSEESAPITCDQGGGLSLTDKSFSLFDDDLKIMDVIASQSGVDETL